MARAKSVMIFTNGAAHAGKVAQRVREEAKRAGFAIRVSDPDVVIAVGGDGTLIKAAAFGRPIMAVKAGTRNHLLDVDPSRIAEAFTMLKSGRYKKAEYCMIEAHFKGRTELAFNEIGLTSVQPQSIIVGLKYGTDYLRLEGDGVLVATPQGSTGWAFSSNGVYLDRRTGAIIVTLLNPVMNPLRSIVLPSMEIELELRDKGYEEHANVVVDGKIAATLGRGNTVRIKKSRKSATVYRFFSTDPIKEMLNGSWAALKQK